MWTPDALFPLMRRQAEGVPTSTLRDAVRWAVNNFVWKSSWLRRTIYIDLKPGVNTYQLNSPVPDENVVNAIAGMHGCYTLGPSRPLLMPRVPYVANPDATQNSVRNFFFKPTNLVVLYPWPVMAEVGVTRFTSIIRVSPTAAAFDDSLYDHWSEVLAQGALSWIHAMPRETWSNPQLAQVESAMFNSGIATAKGQAATGMQAQNMRVVGRNWAI